CILTILVLLKTAGSNQDRLSFAQEVAFVRQKLDWLFSREATNLSLAPDESGAAGLKIFSAGKETFLGCKEKKIFLQEGSGEQAALTSNLVTASSCTFKILPKGEKAPAGVELRLVLTPAASSLEELTLHLTKYLRQ
ncbi:MAG TPA: hypothetical protein VHA30_02320, partial [Patescibacteria group bacterium]|nr:hypothetical protein [Patescibacteria group bacterium]